MSLSESSRVLQTFPQGWDSKRTLQAAAALRRVVILRTLWYPELVEALDRSAQTFLLSAGVPASALESRVIPGSFELPLAAAQALREGADFVVALGCIVRGGTPHFDYVCRSAAEGLMRVQLDAQKPVGFGILTVDHLEQAQVRLDKGAEAAHAAFFMWAQGQVSPSSV